MRKFKIGDKVRLSLGIEGNRHAPSGLRRWDECEFTISRIGMAHPSEKVTVAYYELTSCKSPYGIPYTILEEWLILVE